MSHKAIAGLRVFVFRHSKTNATRCGSVSVQAQSWDTVRMGQLLRPAARLTPGSFFYSWAGLLRPYAGNAPPIWGRLLLRSRWPGM